MYERVLRREFTQLKPDEILREMRSIISLLELKRTVFFSNHASNFLPLTGRFPLDKGRLLDQVDRALNGEIDLRKEYHRGL